MNLILSGLKTVGTKICSVGTEQNDTKALKKFHLKADTKTVWRTLHDKKDIEFHSFQESLKGYPCQLKFCLHHAYNCYVHCFHLMQTILNCLHIHELPFQIHTCQRNTLLYMCNRAVCWRSQGHRVQSHHRNLLTTC